MTSKERVIVTDTTGDEKYKVIIRKSTNRNDKMSDFLVGSSDKPHNRAVAATPKNA